MGRQEVKQSPIKSASFRVVRETPGHDTFGVWINGGKAGDLVVRKAESVAFEQLMRRAGFVYTGDVK